MFGWIAAALVIASCNPSQSTSRSGDAPADVGPDIDQQNAEVSRAAGPLPIAGTKLTADNGRGIDCVATNADDICTARTDQGPATSLAAGTKVNWILGPAGSTAAVPASQYVKGGAGVRIARGNRSGANRLQLEVTTAGKMSKFDVVLTGALANSSLPFEAMHFAFEDAGPTEVRDSSGQGNHALSTASNLTFGRVGPRTRTGLAVGFPGTDINLLVGNAPSLNFSSTDPGFSVAVWIQSPTSSGTHQIIEKFDPGASGAGFKLFVNGSSGIGFSLGSVDSNEHIFQPDAANVADGQWHHLVWSVDFATKRSYLYVDGTQTANVDVSEVELNLENVGALLIGGTRFSAPAYFRGEMDDLILYRAPLSATQATGLYQSYQ